eukprot:TRINITY_DN26798_c0_g1_i3.p1 TRINITY_DN26798_c0_g1~~TRINITY_DN26798_c0_g1_i3.p1  ORF type:complete len:239 (-),score=43.28 TRINITY_DN26798_c0_g1_i3:66-782(-)
MIRRPPRSTLSSSSAASDVYKRQGACAPAATGSPARWCYVEGWCRDVVNGTGLLPWDPKPKDTGQIVSGVEDMSLFVRLNSAFPSFGVTLNTAADGLVPGLNQWYISDLLAQAKINIDDIVAAGAVVLMNAKYDCDLNSGSGDCKPDWSFSRLDKTGPGRAFSTGFNYYERQFDPRFPNERTVIKRWGLKLQIDVTGKAGKFSFINFLIAIGSGVAFLSVASLVTLSLIHISEPTRPY